MIRFGFADGFQRLLLVGAHGNLGNVYIAIGHGHEAQVFLADPLAGRGKFGNSCRRRRFGRLATRVGIDFRIEDEDVDIFPCCQYMVEAAVADIIGPAVAAEDPVAAFDEEIPFVVEVLQDRILPFMNFQKSCETVGTLPRPRAFSLVVEPVFQGIFDIGRDIFMECGFCQAGCMTAVVFSPQEHAEAILGIVFKEGEHDGPWPLASVV